MYILHSLVYEPCQTNVKKRLLTKKKESRGPGAVFYIEVSA